jgi:hypothetical protein
MAYFLCAPNHVGRTSQNRTAEILAHVLVVVGVQHVCPTVPELVGRLQCVLVDLIVGRGERNSFLLDLPSLA